MSLSATGQNLIAQYFEIREVGKTIKSTKKQYVWRFKLDAKDYTIEMFTSILSGKKKILQNGQVIYQDSKYKSAFLFPWNIGRNALSIVQHGDKFELRINNQSFTHLWDNERTKKNFNFDAVAANTRPPYDSVGGTDYAKPKNYDAYGTQSASRVTREEKPEKKHVSLAQPPSRPERHRSAHHSNQERGSGFDDDVPSDSKYPPHIPPEIAAAMDPQELAMQIQMYEEYAKKHQKDKDREQRRTGRSTHNESSGKLSSKRNAEEQPAPLGGKAVGFAHGFDRMDAPSQAKPAEKKSALKKHEDDVAAQGGAAFDFDFGGASKAPEPIAKKEEKKESNPANNLTDLLDLLSFDAPTTTQPQQPPQPQPADIFGGINLAQPPQAAPATDMFNLGQGGSAAVEDSKPKGFMPNLSSFLTAQPNQQQQQQMQQQMMMMNMMNNNNSMMGGQYGQFQTAQNNMGGGFDMGYMQNMMGGGQFNGMGGGNLGGGMQQQYQTGVPQQQQPFDMFGGSNLGASVLSQQQPQAQQQQVQQQQYNQFQTAAPAFNKPAAPQNDLFSDLSAYGQGLNFSQPQKQVQQQPDAQLWGGNFSAQQKPPQQQPQPQYQGFNDPSLDFLQPNNTGFNASPPQQQNYGGGYAGGQQQTYATHQQPAASTPFDDLF